MSNLPKTNMITQQIRSWGVSDETVIHLFETIDRARFVTKPHRDLAYADMNLPMAHGEEMLSPKIQAKILDALHIKKSETVLEVGTGNGFLTALLSHLAKQVVSVEFHRDIATLAAKNLAEQVCHNIDLAVGNAANAWKLMEPVEVILITGSLPFLPESFKACLSPTGRIFAILGEGNAMRATVIQREKTHFIEKTVFETHVRPLLRAPEPERFTF